MKKVHEKTGQHEFAASILDYKFIH